MEIKVTLKPVGSLWESTPSYNGTLLWKIENFKHKLGRLVMSYTLLIKQAILNKFSQTEDTSLPNINWGLQMFQRQHKSWNAIP